MVFKRKLAFGFAIFLLLVGLIVTIAFTWEYSSGSRSGKLVKISEKGFLLKTWEGSMDLGSGDQLTWEFSIRDDKLAKELLTQLGEMVTLDYREHLFRWIYSTKYNVFNFRIQSVNTAKLCPFLYLLDSDPGVQRRAADIIKAGRKDLVDDVQECMKKIGR